MKTRPPENVFGFIIYFLKPHWKLFAALIISGICYGIFTTAVAYMLKIMVDSISEASTSNEGILQTLKYPALGYLSFLFLEIINYRLADVIKLLLFPLIRKDIHRFSFIHLTNQSYSYFQENFAGNLSNRMSELNSGVVSVLAKFDGIFATLVQLLIAIIVLCSLKYYFVGILVIWAVTLFTISFIFSGKIVNLSKDFTASKSKLMGVIVDNFTNIINVLSFANKKYESKIVLNSLNNTVSKDQKMQWKAITMRTCQDVSFLLMIISTLILSIFLFNNSQITIGDFVLIVSLITNIGHNMWWVANSLVEFSGDIGKCAQGITIINSPIKIKDKPNAKDIKIKKGEILFENVTFHYHKKKTLFENKNIKINQGEKIGLVGLTGSGKSSFINLIMRFYEPVSGRILIDGHDISSIKMESLRRQIAMIPQDTSLFHRTIMENIHYGNINAKHEEIINAAKQAYCHEFIEELPEKYHTEVGERGVKLSGGQRQRIAIARAFLKKAPIIIMDEATSALDSITEKKIQKSLDKLTHNKTTIVIAHRLSTLADMDRILVFDKGKIIQDGSHLQLIRKEGHYKKLWKMQADGFLPEEI